MTDLFESPKLLLGRARERTRELEARIKAFIAKKPYTHVIEPEEDGLSAFKIRITEKVPSAARLDAFEIGVALRSVLDHAVYAAAQALRGGSPKSTKFPFGDTPEDVENDIKRGCRDVPPEIVAVLRTFKPYQGGNNALWALNKMRNAKSHQVVTTMAMASGGSSMLIRKAVVSGPIQMGMHRWDAAKQELTYMRARPDGVQGDYDIKASADVVLADVPGVAGQPAIAVFNHFGDVVEGVLRTIEAETIRLLAQKGA